MVSLEPRNFPATSQHCVGYPLYSSNVFANCRAKDTEQFAWVSVNEAYRSTSLAVSMNPYSGHGTYFTPFNSGLGDPLSRFYCH